jgi:hypothetical protein
MQKCKNIIYVSVHYELYIHVWFMCECCNLSMEKHVTLQSSTKKTEKMKERKLFHRVYGMDASLVKKKLCLFHVHFLQTFHDSAILKAFCIF